MKAEKLYFNQNEELFRNAVTSCERDMERVHAGEKAEDVLRDVWMNEGGLNAAAADKKIQEMESYNACYVADIDAIKTDREGWVRGSIADRAQFMDAVERCKLYRNLTVALRAQRIRQSGAEDAEEQVAEMEASMEHEFSEDSAEAYEENLLDALVEEYLASDFISREIGKFLDTVAIDGDAEEITVAMEEYGENVTALRMLVAARLSILARKGTFADLDARTSEKELFYAAAAGADVGAVAMDVQKGKIPVHFMSGFMKVVDILLTMGATYFIGTGIAKAAMLFVSPLLAWCPVALLAMTVVVTVISTVFAYRISRDPIRQFSEHAGAAANEWISRGLSTVRNACEAQVRNRVAPADLDPDTARVFFNVSARKEARLIDKGEIRKERDYVFKKVKA